MEQTSLLSQSVWLSLSRETREKLAVLFSLNKSGGVQVSNGPTGAVVLSDGYTYQDLSVITTERMQEVTGSDSENFYLLFKKVVAIVNDEVYEDELEELIEVVEEEILENVQKDMEESDIKKFCQYCDSKGVRHLKICTRNETQTA